MSLFILYGLTLLLFYISSLPLPSIHSSLQAGLGSREASIDTARKKNQNYDEGIVKQLLVKRREGTQRGDGLAPVRTSDNDVVSVAIVNAIRSLDRYVKMQLEEAPFSAQLACDCIKKELKGECGKGMFGRIVSMRETRAVTLGVAPAVEES